MSTGPVNQRKLYDGYARIALQLGAEYALFPFSADSPTDDGKSTGPIQIAVSSSANFLAPLQYNKAVWTCYADGDLFNQFDIFVGPYGTFYLGDKQPYAPLQAVRCNRTVSLGRVEYSTSGALSSSVVNYATGIPVFMQFTREDIQKPASTAGATLGRAITHWNAFIPMPQGTIKQDDILIDQDGLNYMVDAPDFTNMGYVVALRLASV